MTRRLIVNADDLGRSSGINRGVARAHRDGVVSSATLMVNYPAAAEVATLAQACPRLGIGLHLAFSGGPAALPAERIPSLVDATGALPRQPAPRLSAAEPEQLQAEARAQLARFHALLSRSPSHVDTHHHAHRLPRVLDAVVALAREHGLPVRSASPEVAARLRSEGIATTDGFLEDFYDREASVETLLRLIRELPPGTSELMCHPAEVDPELAAASSYAAPRAAELAALTDPGVRRALERSGIELVHFGAL